MAKKKKMAAKRPVRKQKKARKPIHGGRKASGKNKHSKVLKLIKLAKSRGKKKGKRK